MKRAWIAGLLMALCLTQAVGAENAAPLPVPSALPTKAQSAKEDALDTVLSQENHPFLDRLTLPAAYTYQTLPLPVEAGQRDLAGLLNVKDANATSSILAIGWERRGPKADESFGGMFVPGGHTQEAGERMLAFNVGLVNGANIVNEIALQSIEEMNASEPADKRLPYDFLTLDMGRIEQLHKLKNVPDTYTFSAHPAFMLDGWVIPLYTRGAITKIDGAYRFLLLTSLDSSWKVTDQAAEDILSAYQPAAAQ